MFQEAGFSSPISLWPSSSSGDPFHTANMLLFIDLWCMERCLGTRSDNGVDSYGSIPIRSFTAPLIRCLHPRYLSGLDRNVSEKELDLF